MDTIERKLREDVEEYGWHVNAGERAPFSYSIGIYHRLGHPEIAILGLPPDTAQQLINEVGEQVRQGKRFANGAVSPDFLQKYDCTFRELPRRVYEDYFGRAIDFYAGREFPVLQLVYPDREAVAVGGGSRRGLSSPAARALDPARILRRPRRAPRGVCLPASGRRKRPGVRHS
jgi:hypothetical protein